MSLLREEIMQIIFDRTKSLQDLEGDDWGEPRLDIAWSSLVQSVYRLRRVPVCEFSADDLRRLITQQLSLDYLVPLAIEALEADPWMPGDSVIGVLLRSLLSIKTEFWRDRPDLWRALGPVLDRAVSIASTLDEWDRFFIAVPSEDSDESDLEVITRALNNHQVYMLQYLGL